MIAGHLLCGFILGAVCAVGSLLTGFSTWGAVGFYVLGGNLGICLSAGALMLRSVSASGNVRMGASMES
jgi:hypothetical protein